MKYIIILYLILLSCKVDKKPENQLVKDSKIEKSNDTIIKKKSNDTLSFKLDSILLQFVNKKNDCWKNIDIKDLVNNTTKRIQTPLNICFEQNTISDFSFNQKFLLLHAIERGILSDGNYNENVEKYNCIFLDIENLKLSKKYSDLFCSGEWQGDDTWVIDEHEFKEAKSLFN